MLIFSKPLECVISVTKCVKAEAKTTGLSGLEVLKHYVLGVRRVLLDIFVSHSQRETSE